MKNKMDYQRYVIGIDLTPRKHYRRHIDNLLDANQLLYDKVQSLTAEKQKMEREIQQLKAQWPARGKDGQYKKRDKKTS